MEDDYEDKICGGQNNQLKEEVTGPQEWMDTRQAVLDKCIAKFADLDYIMEPNIATQLTHYFQANGTPKLVIKLLSTNYTAVARMSNLLMDWLVLAGVQLADVHDMIENRLKDMIIEVFDPKKADTIIFDECNTPSWLKEMIAHPNWRTLVYRLAEQYPDCLMLNFAIKLICESGYESEIKSVSIAAQQIDVFSRVLQTSIAKCLSRHENWKNAVEECAKLICHGQHTYVYSLVLIQMMSQESQGGFIMKRLAQEITKYALKNNHDVVPITMALNGSSQYPQVCCALTSILSRNALDPNDITVLFRNYTSDKPPPVDLIRNPQFLDLLIDTLFKAGVEIYQEFKAKCIYLLAYAASVVETTTKKGLSKEGKRSTHKDELEQTMQAIETVHAICNVSHASSEELIGDVATLYSCIRFPVVGAGIIRWVEDAVTDSSYHLKSRLVSCPLHLALLDEVATEHTSLHDQILRLLIRTFESKQDGLDIVAQLAMRKVILDRMVHLLAQGCVSPVVKYVSQCFSRGDTDISLIRYFVMEVLEIVTHPYSPEFVQLFLPMVENEDISSGPASEFIAHCKANCMSYGGCKTIL